MSGNDTVYGYNCLKFDIPFIVARINHHGIMDSETYRLIHDKKWFDLYQYQGDNYVSMDKWVRSYGIERTCHFYGRDMLLFYYSILLEFRSYSCYVDHITRCSRCYSFIESNP